MLNRFGQRFAAVPERQKPGFENIILKFNKMVGVFTSSEEADFFHSETFDKIIETIKQHPNCSEIKEKKEKLTLVFEKVNSVKMALERLSLLK